MSFSHRLRTPTGKGKKTGKGKSNLRGGSGGAIGGATCAKSRKFGRDASRCPRGGEGQPKLGSRISDRARSAHGAALRANRKFGMWVMMDLVGFGTTELPEVLSQQGVDLRSVVDSSAAATIAVSSWRRSLEERLQEHGLRPIKESAHQVSHGLGGATCVAEAVRTAPIVTRGRHTTQRLFAIDGDMVGFTSHQELEWRCVATGQLPALQLMARTRIWCRVPISRLGMLRESSTPPSSVCSTCAGCLLHAPCGGAC